MDSVNLQVQCVGGPWNDEFVQVQGRILPYRMDELGIKSFEFIAEQTAFSLATSEVMGYYELSMEFGRVAKLTWKWHPNDGDQT